MPISLGWFGCKRLQLQTWLLTSGIAVRLGDQQKQVPPGVGMTMPLGVGVGTEHTVRCTPLVWAEKNLRTNVSHPGMAPVKTALHGSGSGSGSGFEHNQNPIPTHNVM